MFRIKCHYPYLNAIICFHFYIFTRHYSNVTDFLFACFKKKSGMELLRTHRDGMLQDYYVRLLGFILWKVRSCCFFISFTSEKNKQTNKNRRIFEITIQSWEYSDSTDPLCHFVGMKKRRKKCLYIFYIYVFWSWLLFSVCETTLNTWSDTVSVYTDNQVFNTCYWYVYADAFITFYGLHSSSSTLKVWKLVASGANTPFSFEIVHWNMEKNWGFI